MLYSIDETSVIPDLYFTSPGTVLAWQFAGRIVLGDSTATARPHIQIWRPTEREKRQAEDDVQFTLIHSTRLRDRDLDNDNGIFTYRLESTVKVEIGDAIGVRQPLNSQLFILFDRGGYTNYITDLDTRQLQLDDANTAMRVPLLRPIFQPLCEFTCPQICLRNDIIIYS